MVTGKHDTTAALWTTGTNEPAGGAAWPLAPGPSACLELCVGRGWTHRAPPPPSTSAMVFPVSTRARREKSECRSGGFWKSRSYIST